MGGKARRPNSDALYLVREWYEALRELVRRS